jgi:hypothetical protein
MRVRKMGIGLVLAHGSGNGDDPMGAAATISVEVANWFERGAAALAPDPLRSRVAIRGCSRFP